LGAAPKRRANMKKKKKQKRCRHSWEFESHNDFRDGEFYVCRKCGKVKFK